MIMLGKRVYREILLYRICDGTTYLFSEAYEQEIVSDIDNVEGRQVKLVMYKA